MTEREQLEQAIAHMEAQRTTLGDAVVDASIAALQEKLAAPEPEPVEQKRRQVTVLLADVAGSTAMADGMDAEDVTELMNALWERLDAVIVDHGGLVDKHMGDAVMALWGAEQTREDDPERAIRAALGMQAALATFRDERDVPLAMRIGINTGPVLLGEVGTTHEFTAMGDTVNVTSRLEHAAPVDGVLICHDTYRHVRGVFEVQALEPIQARGKTESIRVYVIERAKPRAFRLATRGVEGIETRMIGRDAELKRVQDALYTVMEDNELQVVTIAGEAGVGKSRLLYEFENWIELLPELTRYFKGRAHPEMQGQPYALLRDLFAFRFQILDSDRAAVVRDKMEQGIGEALGQDEQGRMKAHFIGQLLGFDFSDSSHLQSALDDPQQIHNRALMYLGEFFRATATQAPTVVFLEDTHWADDSSLDVIDRLARMVPDQRILIVCLARPALFERRPHWGEGQEYHTRLELSPLSRRDSRRLVEEILQKVEDVPDDLHELVVGGAEGNPFYVEELIKMLIEDGVIVKGEVRWHVELARLTEVHVPPTLTGVLQARLDSLSPEERTVLQQASVVGRIFWDDTVRRLSADSERTATAHTAQPLGISQDLDSLRGRELIFHRETSSFADAQEYIFKHAVLREVTYESVLKRVRRIYHGLVAEWLVEHSSERADEYAGLIADHLEAAGQAERAGTYLRRAGEQAAARYANAEAVRYLSRALELTPETDYAERYVLVLAREEVYDLQGERNVQRQDLAALEQLADALGDDRWRAEVSVRQAEYAMVTGDYPAGLAAAQAAVGLAQVSQAIDLEAQGYSIWASLCWAQGDVDAGRNLIEQALALAQSAQARDVEANCLRLLGDFFADRRDYAGARACYQQALHVCREIGSQRGKALVLNNIGITYLEQGALSEAKAHFKQALHIFRKIGHRRHEGGALYNLSAIASDQGDYAGARTYCEQSLRICREIDDRAYEGGTLSELGRISGRQGDYTEARAYCEQAQGIARELGDPWGEADASMILGDALLGLGNPIQAAAAFQQATAVWQDLGKQHLAVECQAGLARVALAQGDLDQAQTQLGAILEYLESNTLDGTIEPFRVYLTCYHVLRANEDPRAGEALSNAYDLLQGRASKIEDEELRRSYLENVPYHREIVEEFRRVHDQDA